MTERHHDTTTNLESLRLPELQARYEAVFGEPTRCPNKGWLIRKISEALATRAIEGDVRADGDEARDERDAALPGEEIHDEHESSSDEIEIDIREDGPPTEEIEVLDDEGADGLSSDEIDGDTEGHEHNASSEEPGEAFDERDDETLDVNDVTGQASEEILFLDGDDPATDEHAADEGEQRAADDDNEEGTTDNDEDGTPHGPATLVPSVSRVRHPRGRFTSMTIEELQAKYLEVLSRPTGSSSRDYLVWKIREAENGRVPIGPRKTRARDGAPTKVVVLPLRLDADLVSGMDGEWRARGIKSRTEFIRRALGHYLAHLGAHDTAALFANTSAGEE